MKEFSHLQVQPYAKAVWKVLKAAYSVRVHGLFSVMGIDK